MSLKRTIYGVAAIVLCIVFMYMFCLESIAALGGPGLSSGAYIVTVDVSSVNINVSHDGEDVLKQAVQGESYAILQDMGDGWLKVKVGDTSGYIPQDGNTSISEKEEMEASDNEEKVEVAPAEVTTARRQNVVNYGLQFVGGRYRYGGNDPHTGVDCSGFTRYVMQYGAGVGLNRSSGSQAAQGVGISAAQMQPGDLVFYGSGSRINHVAMYIGNGQIVHASTYKTGIKVSNWNYRQVVRIVNVLGD